MTRTSHPFCYLCIYLLANHSRFFSFVVLGVGWGIVALLPIHTLNKTGIKSKELQAHTRTWEFIISHDRFFFQPQKFMHLKIYTCIEHLRGPK